MPAVRDGAVDIFKQIMMETNRWRICSGWLLRGRIRWSIGIGIAPCVGRLNQCSLSSLPYIRHWIASCLPFPWSGRGGYGRDVLPRQALQMNSGNVPVTIRMNFIGVKEYGYEIPINSALIPISLFRPIDCTVLGKD